MQRDKPKNLSKERAYMCVCVSYTGHETTGGRKELKFGKLNKTYVIWKQKLLLLAELKQLEWCLSKHRMKGMYHYKLLLCVMKI